MDRFDPDCRNLCNEHYDGPENPCDRVVIFLHHLFDIFAAVAAPWDGAHIVANQSVSIVATVITEGAAETGGGQP